MKKAEFLKQVEAGEPMVMAEWRSCNVRPLSGTTAKGKPYSMVKVEHRLEIAGAQITLNESLPDGTKPDAYKCAFVKGQMVSVKLSLRDAQQGKFYVDGAFDAITA